MLSYLGTDKTFDCLRRGYLDYPQFLWFSETIYRTAISANIADMKRAIVIGAGFGGMSVAAYLARADYSVTVVERNDQPGGRAYTVQEGGFTWELGPSWYMMPDVFREFFADFGHEVADFYDVRPLSPSYRVFDNEADVVDVGDVQNTAAVFEAVSAGDGEGLKSLLHKTHREYDAVRAHLLTLDWLQLRQAFHPEVLKFLLNPRMIGSYDARIRRHVKDERLVRVLEFMTVFMGGSPQNIPGMYSLLSYVDMGLGIGYPMGGFRAVARAFRQVGEEQGVCYRFNTEVQQVIVKHGRAVGVRMPNDEELLADIVVANADYHHVQTALLPHGLADIPTAKWDKKVLSPSGLLLSFGVKKKLPGVLHHNLFFDTDWQAHFNAVFDAKQWSQKPLFYLCVPSKTDPSVAPKNHENLFVLAPQAAGVEPSAVELQASIDDIVGRIDSRTGGVFSGNIIARDVRTMSYFAETFHAYQGNAFGLAHTLRQSALFRPPVKAKKVAGLYFVGQYTNPGTGVPMVVLSGKTVAEAVVRYE